MQTLTRDQAIKRIKDIYNSHSVDHLRENNQKELFDFNKRVNRQAGAIAELMAIFDIKEEELK